MKTVHQLVDCLARHSGHPEPFVRQIGRRLREDGALPACNGSTAAPISTRDIASLMLAVVTTDVYSGATANAQAFGDLRCA